MSTNFQSARMNPTVITESLSAECKNGFMTGPYREPPYVNLQVRAGCSPKKDGSWRMILHLSSPENVSVNDGIDKTNTASNTHR